MNDYASRHMKRWQTGSLEDWQTVLRDQNYGEEFIADATKRAQYLMNKGINMRAAREDAIEDCSWQSSGQF